MASERASLPTHAEFTASVNSVFRVQSVPGQTVDLRLKTVSALVSSQRHTQFSILFEGPRDRMLPQLIYRLDHELLGAIDLFLVPIGKNEQGFLYEAVFSQLRKGETPPPV